MRIILIAASLFLHSLCFAELKIKGEWIQGALLQGHTSPQNKISVLDRDVYVSEQGTFVFGLGRDTPDVVNVKVAYSDGAEKTFTYAVKQREYAIQRIDGVEQKYVAPPPEVSKRIKDEAALVWKARQKNSRQSYFANGFHWPLIGRITGVYGSQRVFNGVPKRPHYGLDIAGPVGATVVAPAKGRVILTHDDMYYSGGTLILDHGQGISSTFIHLSKVLVKEGDLVDVGQAIAEVGATGRVTGPHLDWRINWFDQRLDPHLLLPPMPKTTGNAVK